MVDSSIVLRKLETLETHHSQISQYAGLTAREYNADWKVQRIIERTLQIMIEICVDIASHIISDKGFRTPATYADTFRVLNENGVIPDALYFTMEKMSKFRNIVVHQYETIDTEIVLSILRKNLADFTRYREAIIFLLRNEKNQSGA